MSPSETVGEGDLPFLISSLGGDRIHRRFLRPDVAFAHRPRTFPTDFVVG